MALIAVRPILYLVFLRILVVPTELWGDEYFEEAPLPGRSDLGFALKEGRRVPSIGQASILAVYAQFADEQAAGDGLPAYAEGLFDQDRPGSFTHFYQTLSLGQLQIDATLLPRRYTSRQLATAYSPTRTKEDLDAPVTGFGHFALEILRQVDADYDLTRFDNDGPDGIANSGDDDGYVDYVIIILRSRPADFLFRGADGIALLGFEAPYTSEDIALSGQPMGIRGGAAAGAIMLGQKPAWTVGVMVHEFGHALGNEPLPDLYDRSHLIDSDQSAAAYSAGIGRWGLMGLGTTGWQRDGISDGPNAFCAWSLEQLDWISSENGRLIEVKQDTAGVRIGDLYQGGAIYKIPLSTPFKKDAILPTEYLLLEYRARSTHYHRNDPGMGLLIWHVTPFPQTGIDNDREEDKRVDLVCADGLYRDAGYDQGQDPDPFKGFDNLDFWAPDEYESYRKGHRGNSGDATDMFDGTRFTHLEPAANPSSQFQAEMPPAYRGPSIRIVERQADAVVVDIQLPRWAGEIRQQVFWGGDILVDGDLRIAPEGELVLHPSAQVRVAGRDRLHRGRDPEQVEIDLQGGLRLMGRGLSYTSVTKFSLIKADSFVFRSARPDDSWSGIFSDQPLDERLIISGTKSNPALDAPIATAVVERGDSSLAVPETFALGNNYPNPFDTETRLPYDLAAAGRVEMVIYNALGQVVRHLVDEYQQAGAHEAVWEGRDNSGQAVAKGVYLCRMEVPGRYSAANKMLFLPTGFAALSGLEEWLQSQDKVDLPGEWEESQALGFAPDENAEYAAFLVGRLWIRLQLQRQYQPSTFQTTVDQLRTLMAPFDGTGRQELERLLQALRPTDTDDLTLVDRKLSSLAQGHSERAGFYYALASWLQPLRTAAQLARHRAVPLGDVLELRADAATARHFALAGGEVGARLALVAGLGDLAEQLETEPRTVRQISALLEVVNRIEQSVQGR